MTDVKYISGHPICDVTARAAINEVVTGISEHLYQYENELGFAPPDTYRG